MKLTLFFQKYKKLIVLFIFMNIVYTLVGYIAFCIFPLHEFFGQLSTTPVTILNIFTRWDGMHYNSIAKEGYGVYNENNIAFFPLYPLIMGILYRLTGILPVYWGLIISRLSYLASMILLYNLLMLDYDEKHSFRTVLYMTVFPASFYFISLYTEALFLLLVLLAFTCYRRKKYLTGAFFAMLSSALRSVGVFMVPVLLIEYLLNNEWEIKNIWNRKLHAIKTGIRPILSLAIVPVGLLAFMIYCGILKGDVLAFSHAQKAYMRFPKLPFVSLWITTKNTGIWLWKIFSTNIWGKVTADASINMQEGLTFLKEWVFGWFFLVMIVLMFKKVRPSYWFYTFLMFSVPFFTSVGNEGLSGMPRYVLILFPAFLFMSLLGENRKFHYSYMTVSFILGIVFMSLFSCWHWVA